VKSEAEFWDGLIINRPNFNYDPAKWWWQECPVCDKPGLMLYMSKKVQTTTCSYCKNRISAARHMSGYAYKIHTLQGMISPERMIYGK